MFLSNNRLSDWFRVPDDMLSVARSRIPAPCIAKKAHCSHVQRTQFIVRLYCRITRNDFLPNVASWHAVAAVTHLNRKLIFKANGGTLIGRRCLFVQKT